MFADRHVLLDRGVESEGVDCYLGSAVQMLFAVTPFVELVKILEALSGNEDSDEAKKVHHLHGVFQVHTR